MILVEQKIKKSSGDIQHLILYKNSFSDISLKYLYNKREIFDIEIFEYFNKYEYNFLDFPDNMDSVEDFFNSFYKIKEYIRLFLIENVNIEDVNVDHSPANYKYCKDIYSFFIKEYEMFL